VERQLVWALVAMGCCCRVPFVVAGSNGCCGRDIVHRGLVWFYLLASPTMQQ